MPDIKERRQDEKIKPRNRGAVGGFARQQIHRRLHKTQSRYSQGRTGSAANVQAAEQVESHADAAIRQSGRIISRTASALNRRGKEKQPFKTQEPQPPSHTDTADTPVPIRQVMTRQLSKSAQQAAPIDAKEPAAGVQGPLAEPCQIQTGFAHTGFYEHPSISSIKARPASTRQLKEKPHFISPKMRLVTEQSRRSTAAPAKTAFTKSFNTDWRTASKLKQQMQRTARKKAVQRTRQTAQAAGLSKKAIVGASKAAAQMVNALTSLAGGGALLAALCFILVLAALLASPFGILFSNEPSPGAVPLSSAITQINIELTDQLAALQDGAFDSITLQGNTPDWRDVISVFASRTAAADDGLDVAALTPDRVERLKAVFWDMCGITSQVHTVFHPGNGDDDPGWTEYILEIFITSKTAQDMKTQYAFTPRQAQALDELLAEGDAVGELLYGLNVSEQAAAQLIQALPDNLAPRRRAIVETACSLVGKVNYFWGGKSLAIGWDHQWAQLKKVWAGGSWTTGTYRPYGLDCSGFVDWVFYNASGGENIPGHGGGAAAQHSYCTGISWNDAQPGDLVFYPGDTHVGIVGGRDENGELLIIHCASGANNVVITGIIGFASVGRPEYFD